MSRFLSALLLAAVALGAAADPAVRQLAQLIEYVGVDYPEAVADGKVINEAEYQEMREFTALIGERLAGLDPQREHATLHEQAAALAAAVRDKAAPETVARIAGALRSAVLEHYPLALLPQRLPDAERIQALYRENCAACHGATGAGDGPAAAALEPPPTDFTDPERARARSLLGLYEAISAGIDGTAMVSYADRLSESERWGLAFYVGGLAYAGAAAPAGPAPVELARWVADSPRDLAGGAGLRPEQIAAWRAHPQAWFAAAADPFAVARRELQAARQAWLEGRRQAAQQHAVAAYLDGFELVENALAARDPERMRRVEQAMMQLRATLAQAEDAEAVAAEFDALLAELDAAERLLAEGGLGPVPLFTASAVILLREGLEAVLVVLALAMVLVRSGRRDGMPYLHAGWIGALLAGALTWWLSQTVLRISGAGRELTEGVAALTAALVLFYVGFWMHRKAQVQHWQRFVAESVQRQLGRGTLWGLAGLSFVAVYREVFETILFYQALASQAGPAGQGALLAGAAAGAGALLLAAWLLIRWSVRLPLARFFSWTVYLLLALSVVLMGKGIAALQEAGVLSITVFPWPLRLDWLGVYPTWEGLAGQLLVVLAAAAVLGGVRWGNGRRPAGA